MQLFLASNNGTNNDSISRWLVCPIWQFGYTAALRQKWKQLLLSIIGVARLIASLIRNSRRSEAIGTLRLLFIKRQVYRKRDCRDSHHETLYRAYIGYSNSTSTTSLNWVTMQHTN